MISTPPAVILPTRGIAGNLAAPGFPAGGGLLLLDREPGCNPSRDSAERLQLELQSAVSNYLRREQERLQEAAE